MRKGHRDFPAASGHFLGGIGELSRRIPSCAHRPPDHVVITNTEPPGGAARSRLLRERGRGCAGQTRRLVDIRPYGHRHLPFYDSASHGSTHIVASREAGVNWNFGLPVDDPATVRTRGIIGVR